MGSLLAQLSERNPDAMLLEPRAVYDPALVDLTDKPNDHWPRQSQSWVAVYDATKCVQAIAEWMECSGADAAEWFDFNTSGAWVGEGTPTFRYSEGEENGT